MTELLIQILLWTIFLVVVVPFIALLVAKAMAYGYFIVRQEFLKRERKENEL